MTLRNDLTALAEWAEARPADETYVYGDIKNCACAQYARHIGVEYHCAPIDEFGTFWQRAEWCAVKATTSVPWSGAATFSAFAVLVRANLETAP